MGAAQQWSAAQAAASSPAVSDSTGRRDTEPAMDEKKHNGLLRDDEQKFVISAMILPIICQAVPGLPETSRYGTRHVQVGMVASGMLAFDIYLCSRVLSSMWSRFTGMESYIISAAIVITAYGKLLLINMTYISIFIVPVTILFFIAALWNKFWLKSGLKKDGGNEAEYGGSKKVNELLLITAFPYYVLSFVELLMRRKVQEQHGGDSLVLSHFLLFLSSALGAVAVMVSWLPVATASPGRAQVLQLLHRTCMVVLTVTVHTMAAEWVREDLVLVCMPELVTVLVWFIIPFCPCVSNLGVYVGISRKITVAAMFVVLAYIATPAYKHKMITSALGAFSLSGCLTFFNMYMRRQWRGSTPVSEVPVMMAEFFAAMFVVLACIASYEGKTRALRVCFFSGCLTFCSMVMLRQWPGSTPVSEVPVKMLQFFAKICFMAVAGFCVLIMTSLGDFENYNA